MKHQWNALQADIRLNSLRESKRRESFLVARVRVAVAALSETNNRFFRVCIKVLRAWKSEV